jgi:16S rRNA (guanine966-N2)-methyltransferase
MALGREALSRGAREAVFVERSQGALRVLEQNIDRLDAGSRSRIVRSNAFRFLDGPLGSGFDVAVADPPYDRGFAARLLSRMAREPFAQELWVEHRSGEEIPLPPGTRQRRYGDTTISIWEAPA